jgi:hypothetical protein
VDFGGSWDADADVDGDEDEDGHPLSLNLIQHCGGDVEREIGHRR